MDLDDVWLEAEEADALARTLREVVVWEQRPIVVQGRSVEQARLVGWAGALPYRYSGQTLPPRAWPDALAQLRDRCVTVCGVPFNHAVLNLYRSGADHMGVHADDEAELGRTPVIAAVSLGGMRRFEVRPKGKKHYRKVVRLRHGSLLVMGGTMQRRMYHSVPKMPQVTEERINVTFRQLMGPPGWRHPDARRWEERPDRPDQ